MKHSILIPALAGALVLPLAAQSGCCGSSRPGAPVYRDAATHESIMEKRGEPMPNPITRLSNTAAPEEVKDSKVYVPESLMSRSDVIHFGRFATLVPKRAILHLPTSLRGSVGMPSGVQMVSWGQFYKANRNWIRTYEVTRAQAEGMAPLPEEATEMFEKSRQLIVATYQSGPISVMPLKEDEKSDKPELSNAESR